MRILITGSRNWSDRQIIEDVILSAIDRHYAGRGAVDNREITIVHGNAPGADTLAKSVAEEYGLTPEPHPADWKKHGKAAGPIRNQEMVDLGADVCLAFPDEDSNGTLDCMARAAIAGIYVYNHGACDDETYKRFVERLLKLMEG